MGKQVDRLVAIIEKLRSPQGCPWDREQTHKSILSCLLDETYEFFEAAEQDDTSMMREELGDVLLQIVFHAQMAKEDNRFSLEDVAQEICEKMVRRHPHVFGDTKASSTTEVIENWEDIKDKEVGKEHRESIIDGIPMAMPALFRAEKVQRRVARVGFDWETTGPALDKVEEEFAEFRAALESGDLEHAEEELGDILFALVNVARHKKICAEDALRITIKKFDKRFRYIEKKMAEKKRTLTSASLEELDALWEESKQS